MFEYFKGRLAEKNPTEAIIDCGGVGYSLNISLQTFSQIKDSEDVMLYAHFIVREDVQQIFGFAQKSERELFRKLISVSGVGANTARMILSAMNTQEVVSAILEENVNALKSVKGIGGKTAERIIVDLKDKLGKDELTTEILGGSYNTDKNEALSALVMLGFAKNAASKALDKVTQENGGSIKVEELIKLALNKL